VRGALRESGRELEGESAGPLVFLARGTDAQPRDPVNSEPLWQELADMGFQTVVPSSLSVREIALALRDARLIVSAEGSHLNHVHYFVPDGIKLVVLQDPRRFLAYHKDLVDYCDGRFGFVVGQPDSELPDRYGIDLDDLKRTIDLMELGSPPPR
jgi:capsular polysaccharide biosynthesis protein